jgi:hypothetical protein
MNTAGGEFLPDARLAVNQYRCIACRVAPDQFDAAQISGRLADKIEAGQIFHVGVPRGRGCENRCHAAKNTAP